MTPSSREVHERFRPFAYGVCASCVEGKGRCICLARVQTANGIAAGSRKCLQRNMGSSVSPVASCLESETQVAASASLAPASSQLHSAPIPSQTMTADHSSLTPSHRDHFLRIHVLLHYSMSFDRAGPVPDARNPST